MTVSLLVVVWGLAAIAVVTVVGRWCRAHPGPAQPAPARLPAPAGPLDHGSTTTPAPVR